MWSKIERYVKKHNLLDVNGLYLIALSGGADSVALLLLMKEAGYAIHAAHCNFHLRGEESQRDEQFCVALCERLDIPLHRAHFDTQTYAELHKVSIEMAARELRYRWFEELRKDIGAQGICVAHHRDDSVETVLLNLVRGTGLRGLTGIQPRNGHILRPLLCVSRSDIEQYLSDKGEAYVTDSTNLEADVQRNKVRLQVLPLLKELNPAVVENIQRTAENLAEAQKVLDGIVEEYKDCNSLYLNQLNKFGSSEYITYEWMKNYGFNGTQAQQVLEAETGRVFTSPMGYDLLVDRGRLLVEPSLKPLKSMKIPEAGTYCMEDGTRLKVEKVAMEAGFLPSKAPFVATLDAEKVSFPLTIRRMEEGDWMVPFGMKGRKLLSDVMTDGKKTLFEKRRQLVVEDAKGCVIWLVGIRTDNRFRVDDTTKTVLKLSVSLD